MSTEVGVAAVGLPMGNKMGEVTLADGAGAIQRVRVARSLWRRFLGLMGRSHLEPDEGLWLIPCRSIHMFFMRTRIDVAFLDRDGVVVKAVPTMRPWSLLPLSVTLLPVRGAYSALEMAPGTLQRVGIRPGSRLIFHSNPAHAVSSDEAALSQGSQLTSAGE